jgi:hypothetical protein
MTTRELDQLYGEVEAYVERTPVYRPKVEPLYCGCGDREAGQNCRCDYVCTICQDDQAEVLFDGDPACDSCANKA